MILATIFDCDGVLIDSGILAVEVELAVATDFGDQGAFR